MVEMDDFMSVTRIWRSSVQASKPILNPDGSFCDKITLTQLVRYLLRRKAFPLLIILRQLHCLVRRTVKNLGKKYARDATVEVLHMFLQEERFLNRHHNELKQKFGDVSLCMSHQIFESVASFSRGLMCHGRVCEDFDLTIKSQYKAWNCDKLRGGPTLYVNKCVDSNELEVEEEDKCASKDPFDKFSMLYDSNQARKGSSNVTNVTKVTNATHATGESPLLTRLQTYNITEHSHAEFRNRVFTILANFEAKSDIETQLLSFVGFEYPEFSEFLLANKNSLKKILEVPAEAETLAARQSVLAAKLPSYGVQVTVQSKQEKDLSKKLLKLEKRKQKHADIDSLLEHTQVQSQYQKAATTPILRRSRPKDVYYPGVFDLQKKTEARHIDVDYLPLDGVEHRSTDSYEEYTKAPVHVKDLPEELKKVVYITDLDDIGQMIFQGIKALNTIQSLVFPVAYSTNENMLVCAPTGAGKTNVALLTIGHQIRQFVNNGVLDRDKLKMVYVVPMKALAAEVTTNLGARLKCLGISVRELTGDMQLTKREIKETQLIVTTPEKWDVITRKGAGDNDITDNLKLIIIDEVHLLHGERGPVIEALVARTLRQVETTQSMIRIVGLSATLPNYIDIAHFLKVNPYVGLFYFDSTFRPVPLTQVFVGVRNQWNKLQDLAAMDEVCYQKTLEFVRNGHQVMIFVHARNMTGSTATVMREKAQYNGHIHYFEPNNSPHSHITRHLNSFLSSLVCSGFGIHHAGLPRTDRTVMERLFRDGIIRVLICTATLAWGVNLPAHAVIIKGTEIYDASRGSFVDVGILDVLQIFGRAGRPQYDSTGIGIIITVYAKLAHYLRLMLQQTPIESSFLDCLPDHLNAEIVLGTVSNVDEAITWLNYTYLHQRISKNFHAYGIEFKDLQDDPSLHKYRKKFICQAAELLDKARMIRFNLKNGDLTATDLGRTASHYYIKYDTVQLFNNCMEPFMTEKELLAMISQAQEFQQLKVRNDEIHELESIMQTYCEVVVPGGSTSVTGKINILMQAYLSRAPLKNYSLLSDQNYITQNVVRITRALFDIALHQNSPILTGRCLKLSQMFELQQWDCKSPFRQFNVFGFDIILKIERDLSRFTIDRVREEDVINLGNVLKNPRAAYLLKKCAEEFPSLNVESSIQPITRSVLRVKLSLTANFVWNDKFHGNSSEAFWLWIEDQENNAMYYYENFIMTKVNVIHGQSIELTFTVPLVEPAPPQYLVRISSERWLGSSTTHALSFRELILPESHLPHTDLLVLQPLPLTALNNKSYEALYTFSHFNPIQTQLFHCLYHTDYNSLIGAPTGSGKTIMSELAMLRLFTHQPHKKVVYIAPLKALVRERVTDWKKRFNIKLGKRVTEVTGDVTPNIREIEQADIIITTPEKWDGLSRSWQTRNYVRQVALMIIDEIHMLGEDRGPVLEVIVSRTNFIAANTKSNMRIVGLSTALANAKDLANWLAIGQVGLYNFRPSVRPVPLEVHISGYPGKHYCPRMISMNKPTYQAIRLHAPDSPSLVFVSSRRQTRLTAVDMMAYLTTDPSPKQWLHMDDMEMASIISGLRDQNLKLCLPFGIGIHHAGLDERDRHAVEWLFVTQKIQVLVATSTLAWGVNFPAHLVVVKGTEYFDAKTGRYVDMPITDVLQMMGRAGRPQFDNSGVAVVLVHDVKKNFYKKFLYEPFPVESNLLQVLPDHVNAEIVAGTVNTKSQLVEYLTWTYFYRRLVQNPTYYKLATLDQEVVNDYLNALSQATLDKLIHSYCIDYNEDTQTYYATTMGQTASYYYLTNETIKHFHDSLKYNSDLEKLLNVLTGAHEYAGFPVRHNEDLLNQQLASQCRFKGADYNSPHTKAFLLLQVHFQRLPMPIADYNTDLKTVLEQTMRILQAMIDIAANNGWLSCVLRILQLNQMIVQGCWIGDSPFLTLYNFERDSLEALVRAWNGQAALRPFPINSLAGIQAAYKSVPNALYTILCDLYDDKCARQVTKLLSDIPTVKMTMSFYDDQDNELTVTANERVPVHVNQQYSVLVTLHRHGMRSDKVPAPYFTKVKKEVWFLLMGYKKMDQLVALKRVMSLRNSTKAKISFVAPATAGHHTLSLYFMSDSYMAIDQQYDVKLKVSC